MYSLCFIILTALTCANALSIEEDSIGELKLETFDTLDDNKLKVNNATFATTKVVWTVTFFSALDGQKLVAEAKDQPMVIGTSQARLTYSSVSDWAEGTRMGHLCMTQYLETNTGKHTTGLKVQTAPS